MRTSFKYEVNRDGCTGYIKNRGLILEINLSKNDDEEMLWDFVKKLSEYIGLDVTRGHYDEDEYGARWYLCGWLEMDREEFKDYKEEYIDFKKSYKYIK